LFVVEIVFGSLFDVRKMKEEQQKGIQIESLEQNIVKFSVFIEIHVMLMFGNKLML